MAEIGKTQKLTIKRTRNYGAHLDGGKSGDILLPSRYVPQKCQPGDKIEVFVYADREDRLRATTKRPFAEVGQFSKLRVKANTAAGTYLDWGLEKDLLVPKSEQKDRMVEGKAYLVFVFLDEKSKRITASALLDNFLSTQPPSYKEGEEVDLFIHEKIDRGYKVIINHSHGGMIYKNEIFKKIVIGQRIKGYIKKIRDDLKIDVSLQKPGHQGFDDISQAILKILKEHGGKMRVTDKSPPEEIYALFGVSKKSFKKAIGGLYKKRRITIDSNGIRLGK